MVQEIIEKRIGIMGGSFDPIHIGHLILAEYAYEQFQLEKILFVPTGNPPHKDISIFSSSEHRLEMISLAIKKNPHFKLSLVEMERDGIIYTYETLELLKQQTPDVKYYFIMGADSMFSFEQWKEPSRITKNCTIVVATRENMDKQAVKDKVIFLKDKYQCQIEILDTPSLEISSRMLREKVKNNKTIKYFITEEVENYINEKRLYKE